MPLLKATQLGSEWPSWDKTTTLGQPSQFSPSPPLPPQPKTQMSDTAGLDSTQSALSGMSNEMTESKI